MNRETSVFLIGRQTSVVNVSGFMGWVRPKTPLSVEQGRAVVDSFVTQYNHERLHSTIGYITLMDKMASKAKLVFAKRKEKLNYSLLVSDEVNIGRKNGQC